MKKLLVFLISALALTNSFAQNVAINSDASLPNNSAMLDVKSTSKGLLIPRVALAGTADVTTVPSPATSLMVYNTTAAGTGTTAVVPGYYYWNGSAWVRLVSSTTTYSSTKTMIPFASGGSVTLTTQANGTSGNVGLVGFGNNATTTIGRYGDIDLLTGPSYSFIAPTSGTITDISGVFSTINYQVLPPGTNITIICQLYQSSPHNTNYSNFFNSIGIPVFFSPELSGQVFPGTTGTGSFSGMSIPVVAGTRLMMVVFATVSSGSGGAGYSIPLYFSGGVNMNIQ